MNTKAARNVQRVLADVHEALYWSLFSNCSMAQFKARRFSFAAANCGTEAVDRIRREDQLPDSPHFSADDRTREGLTWKLMQ
jgi:hypothetical protein